MTGVLRRWWEGLTEPVREKLQRRHLLMPGILLVHALLLTIVFLSPSEALGVRAIGSPLSVFDVASEEQRPSPPEPQPQPEQVVMPEPIVDLDLEAPPIAAAPVFDAAAAQRAGFGTTCEVAGTLARAFGGSELVRAQLERIGPEARSVANAIMFWDGQWVDVQGRAPEDALETLRRAIMEGVRAAPPECLSQDVVGPRFIAINEGKGTMILVLGSGTWRWEQLLQEPEAVATEMALRQ
ncbi:MAG: hypothetical protein M3Q08_16710 [Pseudomonadota bacterium]|nr:hypothetical protein [Pseudomonadota bacterium]